MVLKVDWGCWLEVSARENWIKCDLSNYIWKRSQTYFGNWSYVKIRRNFHIFFQILKLYQSSANFFSQCFEQFAIWKRLLPHKDAFCNEILNAVWRKIGMLSKELKAKVAPRPMQMMVANQRLAQSGWSKHRKLTENRSSRHNFW